MAVDLLVVSLGTTPGWRVAAGELASSVRRAGGSAEIVTAAAVPAVRTFALTDFVQALACRRAAAAGIRAHHPRAIVYCSITAALLWPAPGAIWFDSVAAENRPGRHGVWQRHLERRRLADAPLLLPMDQNAMAPLRGGFTDSVVLPIPVDASAPSEADPVRDVVAVAYAGDPVKRQIGYVLDCWDQVRRPGETLVVVGNDTVAGREGIEIAGKLAPAEYRALLRRTRLFVAAPRREDYGIAALEALADGCMLVSTPSPGPYAALGIAQTLDSRLVSEDLAAAIRIGLDEPAPGYHARAVELMDQFRRASVDQTVAEVVLPRLLQAPAR